MWAAAAIAFTVAAVVAWIATEILREVVDRKRVRQRGIGGTQDIALWGTVVLGVCAAGAVASLVGWLLNR